MSMQVWEQARKLSQWGQVRDSKVQSWVEAQRQQNSQKDLGQGPELKCISQAKGTETWQLPLTAYLFSQQTDPRLHN